MTKLKEFNCQDEEQFYAEQLVSNVLFSTSSTLDRLSFKAHDINCLQNPEDQEWETFQKEIAAEVIKLESYF